MITIDRSSGERIADQIAAEFRYRIARGHYAVGADLPSTRAVAREVGVSFHTVRNAFRILEGEGLVQAVSGRGFVVQPLPPGTDSDRMEYGADIIRGAMQRLIGIGLSESDIDYLFEEQLATIAAERAETKTVFVGQYREQAQEIVGELGRFRLGGVVPITVDEVGTHEDADYAICPFPLQREVRAQVRRTEVVGVDVSLAFESLELASRLMPHETLTLVTRFTDAIGPITRDLRARTAFPGQLLAGSVDKASGHVEQLVSQADAVLYTPAARTRVAALIGERPSAVVKSHLPEESLRRVQDAIPE